MPVQIVDGFRLNANTPIDTRMVTTGAASRNNLTYKYAGLRVYDTVDKAAYVYIDGAWQAESGGANFGLSSIKGGLNNYVTKFSTNGLTHSVIKEQFINNQWFVGIDIAGAPAYKVDVNGTLRATALMGNIDGEYVIDASLVPQKLRPAGQGAFVMKSVNGVTNWALETAATSVAVTNNTSFTETFVVLVQEPGGKPLLLHDNGTEKRIAVSPATSQMLVSKHADNNEAAPGYSFRGKSNTGFYAQSTSIGISWQGAKVLEGRTLSTTLYRNGTQFLQNTSTGTEISSAFTVTSGNATTLNGTLTVAADQATTLGGTLTVEYGKATLLGGTLDVAAATNLASTLTVASGKATSLGGTLTVAADQATTLGGTLTVATNKQTFLGGTVSVYGGFRMMTPDSIFNVTGMKQQMLYANNEFNFVNNDSFNQGTIYINWRGALTNGITSYKFQDGRSSPNYQDITKKLALAEVYTGGIYSYGKRDANNTPGKGTAAASFYATQVGLHLGAYDTGPNTDSGYWIQTENYSNTDKNPLYINPKGGTITLNGNLRSRGTGIAFVNNGKTSLPKQWTVTGSTSGERWLINELGTTGGSFTWLPKVDDADRIFYSIVSTNGTCEVELWIETESNNLAGVTKIGRASAGNSMCGIIPAGARYAVSYEGTYTGNGNPGADFLYISFGGNNFIS